MTKHGPSPSDTPESSDRRLKVPCLFVGHPACGAAELTRALQAAGLQVEHEALGADGMVSWWHVGYAQRPGATPGGPMRFRATNRMPALLAERVQHFIRHPLTAIPWIVGENEKAGRASPSFLYRAKIIRTKFEIDITELDRVAAAAVSYVCWNRMAENLAGPYPPIRIEAPDPWTLRPDVVIGEVQGLREVPEDRALSPEAISAAVPLAIRADFDRYMALYDNSVAAPEVFRNVMLYWSDPNPPPSVLEVAEAWKATCPGWTVTLHSRDSAAAWLAEHYGADFRRLFLRCRVPAMQADMFRIFWAIEEGGLYCDISYAPRRMPVFFDPAKELTAVSKGEDTHFINGVFYARKGSSELKKVAFHILKSLSLMDNENIWSVTGPGAWTAAIGKEATDTIAVISRQRLLHHELYHTRYAASTRGSEKHWSSLQRAESIYNPDV